MKKKTDVFFDKTRYLCMVMILLFIFFAGCSSSSDDYVSTREGRFIDSNVQGLSYISGGQTGVTDKNGTFFYEKGKDVTFMLGNITIGSASTILNLDKNNEEVAPEILVLSPRELVPTAENDRNEQVTNILRFLQTLDDDQNPDNGIVLSEEVAEIADRCSVAVDFTLSLDQFKDQIEPVINELLGYNRELIPTIEAQNHFIKTKLQFLLNKAVDEHEVPGVALVAEVPCPYTDDYACEEGAMAGVTYDMDNDLFTWKLTAGYANLQDMTPMTTETRFRIASLTKTFVAMTVMQLVEEETITLDDSIEQWLPELMIPNGENIKIRNVVNHSSGLYNFYEVPSTWFFDFMFLREDIWEPETLIDLAIEEGPDFSPGTAWHYSNTNYVLLGMLIEKVTGNTWENEIRNRFIKQYELNDTIIPESGELYLEGPYYQIDSSDFPPYGYEDAAYANGYIDLYDLTGAMYGEKYTGLEDASTREPSAASSSANMISTPENLCKWIDLIGKGTLFGENSDFVNDDVDETLYFPMNPVVDCGPSIYKNNENNMLIVSGNFLGYDVSIVYDQNHNIPISVCSNRTLKACDGQIKDLVTFDAIEILGEGLPLKYRVTEINKSAQTAQNFNLSSRRTKGMPCFYP